jgi:hypothetical protein
MSIQRLCSTGGCQAVVGTKYVKCYKCRRGVMDNSQRLSLASQESLGQGTTDQETNEAAT